VILELEINSEELENLREGKLHEKGSNVQKPTLNLDFKNIIEEY